jgi:hypothetical protein
VLLKSFLDLLPDIEQETPNFPPAILYNEGWLLRLVVDWFYHSEIHDHPLSFPGGGHWFSEARLPSAFLPRFNGDPLAEAHTNADGVIGQFTIGSKGKTDLVLKPDANHFVVLEAKMYSGLSKGVTHAKYFDQAARSVACMAEVLKRAECTPATLSCLGFHVLAPDEQIKSRTFSRNIDKRSIVGKVDRRVSSYEGERDDWFRNWFKPTMERIEIRPISWEAILNLIIEKDSRTGKSLEHYYAQCLVFNA